jgi:hypothetical protein
MRRREFITLLVKERDFSAVFRKMGPSYAGRGPRGKWGPGLRFHCNARTGTPANHPTPARTVYIVIFRWLNPTQDDDRAKGSGL